MFADPTTISTATLTYDDNNPVTGGQSAASGLVLNRVGPGSTPNSSVYRPTAAVLASLTLEDLLVTVSHQPTKAGRIQSLFRVDVKKLDSLGKSHSQSVQLKVDREAGVTSEGQAALNYALATFSKALYTASGSTLLNTSAVFSQLLNGEA